MPDALAWELRVGMSIMRLRERRASLALLTSELRMSENSLSLSLEYFAARTHDKVRYADTDRQGHVNNAAFASFCETGRVEFLFNPDQPLYPPGAAFVIARLILDFRGEIRWPGTVEIGTRVEQIGRSSFTLKQALFQGERLVATAETVIVLMDEETRRSTPLPPATADALKELMVERAGPGQ